MMSEQIVIKYIYHMFYFLNLEMDGNTWILFNNKLETPFSIRIPSNDFIYTFWYHVTCLGQLEGANPKGFKMADACLQTSMKLLFSWFKGQFWEPRSTYIMAEIVVSLSELWWVLCL